jgi:hypothetical protein
MKNDGAHRPKNKGERVDGPSRAGFRATVVEVLGGWLKKRAA